MENPWIKCPLKIDMGVGISWGGCLDFDIEELGPEKLVGSVEGLSRDIKQFYHIASLAYKAKYEVISTEDIDESEFQHNNFIKDLYRWKARFYIEKAI